MDDQRSSPRSLFGKYFRALFAAVVLPLLVGEGSEAWLGYRDRRALLDNVLRAEARLSAAKIVNFLDEVTTQLAWAVQLPWTEEADDSRRTDAARVMRLAPAVLSLAVLDSVGRERLFTSRISLNRSESRADRSAEPAVSGTLRSRIWYGPVTLRRASEPYMTIGVAGPRAANGIVLGEINLKFIWDVITAIQVGKSGLASVLDQHGTLVAHPDLNVVLRGPDEPVAQRIDRLLAETRSQGGTATGLDGAGRRVMVAAAPVTGTGWTVLVYQPVAEAFEPIYAALWRTAGLLVAGAAFAGILAFWLARRMARPIQMLEEGAARIGAGQFGHRIHVGSGDELGRLATQFNRMAAELALSQQRSERIVKLKRFLAPRVAELIDEIDGEHILSSRRADVVVVFCDLRGFTAFSAIVEPDVIMGVLNAYYEALGRVVAKYEGTPTSVSGDGMMVLVNAPLPCRDPAFQAARMAVEMQAVVQDLIMIWRASGHRLGFGIGLAMGTATVGRIGSESRMDYTAIGNVVNLASRLCSVAQDRQILTETVAAEAVSPCIRLRSLGARALRGYLDPIEIFAVEADTAVRAGGWP